MLSPFGPGVQLGTKQGVASSPGLPDWLKSKASPEAEQLGEWRRILCLLHAAAPSTVQHPVFTQDCAQQEEALGGIPVTQQAPRLDKHRPPAVPPSSLLSLSYKLSPSPSPFLDNAGKTKPPALKSIRILGVPHTSGI